MKTEYLLGIKEEKNKIFILWTDRFTAIHYTFWHTVYCILPNMGPLEQTCMEIETVGWG